MPTDPSQNGTGTVNTVPAAATLSFNTAPVVVRHREFGELRPFAVVIGGTILTILDTPEKIGGLQKPEPVYLRHRTMTSEHPFDKVRLHDYGTPESGPIHGLEIVERGSVRDALSQVLHEVIVGWTPESIAEEIKQLILAAFRGMPEYADGVRPLDAPVSCVRGLADQPGGA